MNRIRKAIALSTLAMTLAGGYAVAQDHPDHHDHPYVRHDEWKKGARINREDWNRGAALDYRRYHLNAPPRGYEWREVDGNYVLAAVATGVIASAIVASTIH
ncbi:Ni/Co efflux regulator RcnB [Silvibacterium bohemicum]|uniref:Ni/Co efflux regulator RcnB n=1 Tax=Silvibacterium bohemicum TaxID=1577686 RepID=A0A841K691_9BACT|nr:RcnB family protein [Silvibacterium bohemicum]MBB6145784.1 Ni/Co efflux regulator RcnB [Silvibacterium bohemicum]